MDSQVPSENSFEKPAVSERKIEANRQNSQKATGPKTARGKKISSRNAMKHGLFARELVITCEECDENEEDLQDFFAKLWEHYSPVGMLEGILVEKIAASWWRGRRVIRAENGAFAYENGPLSPQHALWARYRLPDDREACKLLRYDSHLEKQLYRAITELERQQKQRKANGVPPPVSANIDPGK